MSTNVVDTGFKVAGEGTSDKYSVGTESMSLDNKLEILEEIGRKDLIGLFKSWKPRVSKARKRGAPLDQRVSITVTDDERNSLDKDITSLKALGEKISMSQFIRNRALGNVDINEWRELAEKELKELSETKKNEKKLKKKKLGYTLQIEEEDDEAEIANYERKIAEIDQRMAKLVGQGQRRVNRLSGRMSMAESETVKWRAQRLTVSTSDFLRMMIFNLIPGDTADAHMSLNAKMRFYVSIIDVAENGWGEAPKIYNCSQCENYMDEILQLKERINLLQNF